MYIYIYIYRDTSQNLCTGFQPLISSRHSRFNFAPCSSLYIRSSRTRIGQERLYCTDQGCSTRQTVHAFTATGLQASKISIRSQPVSKQVVLMNPPQGGSPLVSHPVLSLSHFGESPYFPFQAHPHTNPPFVNVRNTQKPQTYCWWTKSCTTWKPCETICLLVFKRESSCQGFLGGARFGPPTVSSKTEPSTSAHLTKMLPFARSPHQLPPAPPPPPECPPPKEVPETAMESPPAS